MLKLEDLASNEQIAQEYKKSFLLNIFKKLVVSMNRNNDTKKRIHKLFLETNNPVETTKIIIGRYFNYDASDNDALTISAWLKAYFSKQQKRKAISPELKQALYKSQNGKCAICGDDLGQDMSKIHVDHIIPWALVGDELPDNYQVLCQMCNECKSSQTDFIFKKLIQIN